MKSKIELNLGRNNNSPKKVYMLDSVIPNRDKSKEGRSFRYFLRRFDDISIPALKYKNGNEMAGTNLKIDRIAMDSENEESVDDVDVESTSSDKEEVLEAMAESLENQIMENMFLYQSHVDLITVLKQLADLDRLRTARNRMSEHFPLTAQLWLDWLDDEIKIAVSENEKKHVLELFDRAVKDYLSVEIWLKYLEFAKEMYGYGSESKMREVRKICEQCLAKAGLHVPKASLLWNSFIDYEKGGLEKVLDNTDLYLNQLKLVGNLYKRMLSCPLIDIDESYQNFSSWLDKQEEKDKIIDKTIVENIYKKSKEKLLKIKEYEDALLSDSENAAQHYKEYMDHEKSKAGSPVRVQYLYERMICDFCLHEELWLDYIDYVSSVLKDEGVVMDVVGRSLRNCPWSCRLHQLHIQFLEKYNHSHKEIIGAFEKAVASGLQVAENFRDIWMTYLEYLRRRYDAPEISEQEESKRLGELRAAFSKAVEFLSQLEGSDPEFLVAQFWARVEANHCRNMEKSRELWNDILSDYNLRTSDMWLEYINIERAFGDSKHLRKLLVRAVQNTHDFPEKIAKYWMNYERDEGTLESYEDCLEKIENRLRQVKEQRDREEAKQLAEKESSKNKSKPGQKKPGLGFKKANASWENNIQNDTNKNKGIKRKHDKSDNDDESPEKKSREETNEELVEKLLAETGKGHGVTVAHDSSKDNRTVFVSNLDFSTEESTIREAFASCGKITDLRLVKDYKGRSKGYCYVEFEKPSEALAGLKKDREMVNSRPMFVSKCDPDSETRSKAFKYSSGIEKNKLFVRGLPFDVAENDLREMFGKYGALKGVRLVTYRNGHSKGLAYVDFEDEVSAAKALLETNGMAVGDRKISVAISNPPERSESVNKPTRSLGRGPNEVGPRKTGRKQLSFVPRSVQLKASEPAESLASLSLASPQPEEPRKKFTNTDFRDMLFKV